MKTKNDETHQTDSSRDDVARFHRELEGDNPHRLVMLLHRMMSEISRRLLRLAIPKM